MNEYAILTDEQFALVGKIVQGWTAVDVQLMQIVARLALAPDFPARTMLDRLPGAALDHAIRNLLDMHVERYGSRVVSEGLASEIKAGHRKVRQLRSERNAFSHALGLRIDDGSILLADMGGWSAPDAEQRKAGTQAPITKSRVYSTSDMRLLCARIGRLIARLELIVSALPEADEGACVARHAEAAGSGAIAQG